MGEQERTTTYDDVFRTECSKLKLFLVPIINELFGTEHTVEDAELDLLLNEHHNLSKADENAKGIPEKITDSCIRLDGKLYHIECQSTSDGSILIRLVEYNMLIALDQASYECNEKKLIIELPASALLMLRRGKDGIKQSELNAEYRYGAKRLTMKIPILNVQAYSIGEIFEKKLFFLIPFFIMRYEAALKELKKIRPAENAEDLIEVKIAAIVAKEKKVLESKNDYDTIKSDLKEIERRLIQSYQSGDMTENDFRNLLELTRIILNKECDGLDDVYKEGLVNAMGGHIIELQTDREQRYEEERRKLQDESRERQAEIERLNKENEELKAALRAALQTK
ncbi:MAG: hypothetical protein K6G83_14220 [Lachnospiraceae bacterium]|nr:hypothetical protein [Lachnospiraceae bacterium]